MLCFAPHKMYKVSYQNGGRCNLEYFSDKRAAICRMVVLTNCKNIANVSVAEYKDVDGCFEHVFTRVLDNDKFDEMIGRLTLAELDDITTTTAQPN